MRRAKLLLAMCAVMGCMLTGCAESGDKAKTESLVPADITYSNEDDDETVQAVLTQMLDKNTGADAVMSDLNFANILTGVTKLEYEVYDNDAISQDGKLTGKNEKTTEVTVKVMILKEPKYFKFTVPAGDDLVQAKVDEVAENLIHNPDNIRGNITLVKAAGEGDEMKISWKSSDAAIVTDTATGDNKEFPAGVVTRGEKDATVTLTASIEYLGKTTEKEYELTVKAAPEQKEYSAYVYTYFQGNIHGKGESQNIHAAVSEDGFFWKALNNNEPILTAELGTKGVRDSFLIRSPEGDRFYLIGTDLDANGGDWYSYAVKGSKNICVWESDDLVNWSEERQIEIAPKNAGCMWAPEATYDPATGEYVVYWATGINGGNGKKIYYAKTRDFWNFTEPQIYKDVENGTTFIDTTMTVYDGTFYRFTKNENEITIFLETSDALLGDYTLVKNRIADEWGVEGPAIYKINGEEKWCLYMDGYADENAGVGYFPLIADSLEDLKTGNFRRLTAGEFEMPEGAKHGSFVPVTREEYDAMVEKWGIK